MANRLLAHLADKASTSSFAIVGPWGSGKTWLLEATIKAMSTGADAPQARDLIRFNPWFFADEKALFVGFAELLLELTPKTQKARRALADLLSTVGPSLKFGNVDLTKLAAKGEERARGLSGPEQIRNRVAGAVGSSKRHVLVIMDDLDRLNPPELLMLFKLIRLIGDVPGISYLLTYDEETLLQLLARTDITANSEDRARRYLEKIVEVKWVVPPLTQVQLDALVVVPIAAILVESAAFESELNPHDVAFDYRLESLLRKRITTPRSADRFVAMIREIPVRALAELNFDDLAFALYLRAYAPRVWSLVVEESELLTGGGAYGFRSQDKAKQQLIRLRDRIRAALANDPGDPEEVLDLIQEHFPRFGNALSDRDDHHGDRSLRISEPEFIARYMWLDLPPGAVSEVAVNRNVRELPQSKATDWLTAEIEREPSLVLESIFRSARADPKVARRVFGFLDHLYENHGVVGPVDAFLGLNARIRVNARLLLPLMKPRELDELLRIDIRQTRLLRRLVVGELRASSYSAEVHAKFLAAGERLALALELHLESCPSPSFVEQETREGLLDLLRIDASRAAAFATRMCDSHGWRADDVASLYVTERVGNESRRIGFSLTALRRHWGADFAAHLASADSIGYPLEWDATGAPNEQESAVDASLARALASYGLKHAIDLNVGDLDDF
jgi:hypothetical protein